MTKKSFAKIGELFIITYRRVSNPYSRWEHDCGGLTQMPECSLDKTRLNPGGCRGIAYALHFSRLSNRRSGAARMIR